MVDHAAGTALTLQTSLEFPLAAVSDWLTLAGGAQYPEPFRKSSRNVV